MIAEATKAGLDVTALNQAKNDALDKQNEEFNQKIRIRICSLSKSILYAFIAKILIIFKEILYDHFYF